MNNLFEMRERLIVLFDDLEKDVIDTSKAKEINNTAGKIMSTIKTQLSYHQLRGETPEISFVGNAAGK